VANDPGTPPPTDKWILPAERVASILGNVGFRGEPLVIALAVAKAESGFDAHAVNWAAASGKWGAAVGLFQVRALVNPRAAGNAMDRRRDSEAMKDPVTNARFAFDLSKGGRSWGAWSAYTNGAYRKHLVDARRWAANPAQGASPDAASSIPLVANDWIDEDQPPRPVVVGGDAHPGDLGNRVVAASIEFSMAEASQVTFEFEDEDVQLLRRQGIREGLALRVVGQRMIVTELGVRQGPGSPHVVVKAQPAGVVRLRGVVPVKVTTSPVEYARRLARTAGMGFVGGPAAASIDIEPATVRLAGSDVAAELDPTTGLAHGERQENAWEVLRRLAAESTGYVCFESGGTLYYATEDWLYTHGGAAYVQVGDAKFTDKRTRAAIRSIGFPDLRRTIKRTTQNAVYRHVEADIDLPPGPGWSVLPGMRLWLAEPSGMVETARPMLVRQLTYELGDSTKLCRAHAASYTAPGDVEAQPDTVVGEGSGSGAASSQNGWPASPDRKKIAVKQYSVGGSSVRLPLAAGASWVLLQIARAFNARVERLDPGQTWGWSYRAIKGSSTLSNHSSGTAIDLNAVRHPLGRRGTFTARQVAEIRSILAPYRGVVRWGGDYRNRPDEMHFEIVCDPATLRARLRDLGVLT
jgi:hypothetical protein